MWNGEWGMELEGSSLVRHSDFFIQHSPFPSHSPLLSRSPCRICMKVSAKTEYACIAMLELSASFGSGEPVRIRKIAEDHGVPSRFLVQILLQLKGAGYVNSTRGAAGGYELVKPPDEISLLEVMSVIEGPDALTPPNATADSPAGKVLHSCWQDVAQVEREMLQSITFADLIERTRRQQENMYYI